MSKSKKDATIVAPAKIKKNSNPKKDATIENINNVSGDFRCQGETIALNSEILQFFRGVNKQTADTLKETHYKWCQKDGTVTECALVSLEVGVCVEIRLFNNESKRWDDGTIHVGL